VYVAEGLVAAAFIVAVVVVIAAAAVVPLLGRSCPCGWARLACGPSPASVHGAIVTAASYFFKWQVWRTARVRGIVVIVRCRCRNSSDGSCCIGRGVGGASGGRGGVCGRRRGDRRVAVAVALAWPFWRHFSWGDKSD